ncbi:hypothetical protein [Nocardia mexicana]|uniref:Small secreted domain DUF320 n=1 Tax=Nocardia mexicana TaxID=279262 RepID=A0A370HE14_9NOCA|nr:hypothetical protein [Nocardia mexicana]RDI55471.1 hypothetical protein DFR68_101304 [Nocardia mexicana]
MTKSRVKFWVSTIGLIAAPLVWSAPAAAEGVALTPEVVESATAVDAPPPCVNYPGNIPCNLSTFSSSLGIGR